MKRLIKQVYGTMTYVFRKKSEDRRHGNTRMLGLVIMIGVLIVPLFGQSSDLKLEQVSRIVNKIRRADYEANTIELKRLYSELGPFADDKELGAKVRYWRGFAMWRSALNGFSRSAGPNDLESDLKQAINEFERALAKDPAFVDARASAGATRGLLMALYSGNPDLAPELKNPVLKQESINKALSYVNQAKTADPENPRVWWVLGPVEGYLAMQRGDGQDKAADKSIETYYNGLKAVSNRKSVAEDPLTPSWGEPELLMSLGASNLYRTTPDLVAAERYVRSALALVPYWHYVKFVLLPAVETAKIKAEIIATERGALDRWSKGDPQGFLQIIASDATYFDPFREKRIDGLKALKEHLSSSSTGNFLMDGYEMVNPHVQHNGDHAILTYNLAVKRSGQEEKVVRWNCTEVYRQIKGSWNIVHSHWSFTKPA